MRLSILVAVLLMCLSYLLIDRAHRAKAAAEPVPQKELTLDEACADPTNEDVRKSCAEFHEAVKVMNGDYGLQPVLGIHVLTSFHLRPAHGGPMVHDSTHQPLCWSCACRADDGEYSVLGFSPDHRLVLMEKMSDSEGDNACSSGARFFIPIEWLKPTTQVSQTDI